MSILLDHYRALKELESKLDSNEQADKMGKQRENKGSRSLDILIQRYSSVCYL